MARHHLDRLAAGGYLEVTLERSPTAGAGRPSKRYRAADGPGGDPTVDFASHRDDLLVSLLGEALELLGPDEAERMAERVGEELRPRAGRAHGAGRGPALACAPPCTPSPTP